MAGFTITNGRGFHVTFENGVTVSVQFGGGNYCERYNAEIGSESGFRRWESADAEVAAWLSGGRWITTKWKDEGDSVLGHQSPADVLALLNWAANYVPGQPE